MLFYNKNIIKYSTIPSIEYLKEYTMEAMNKAKDEKSELYGYGGQLSGILLFLLLFIFYFI